MAAAAGTLRLTETGEQRADPLAAKVLAPRLAEDYEHVAPVLRNQGAAAEEAVLALLKSKDSQVRQAALRLLKDIATEKSVPALRRVAAESEPVVADLAREVLQRFQPPDVAPGPGVGVAPPGVGPPVAAPPGVVPPVAARPGVTPPASDKPGDFPTALADLDSNDIARRKAAVAALPSFSVEEAQRLPVMRKLLAMLRANDNTVPIPDVVAALAVWGNEKMIPDLLNLLKKDASPDARHAAMRVFANYKDQRAAVAVAGWIIIDPVPTADTLIAMGPAAEDAVIPYLRYEKNATARIDMARILSRIGTRKCLSELNVAAHDPKVPAAHDAALSAMEAVKARIQAETPGK
jgi:HEAT repeat protein